MWSSVHSLRVKCVAILLRQWNDGWKGVEKVGIEMDSQSGTQGWVQEPQPGQNYCFVVNSAL